MSCVHHWQLSQDGPTSTGVCKLCGASREFLTSGDGIDALRKRQPIIHGLLKADPRRAEERIKVTGRKQYGIRTKGAGRVQRQGRVHLEERDDT